jgi:hypothetical protein
MCYFGLEDVYGFATLCRGATVCGTSEPQETASLESTIETLIPAQLPKSAKPPH